MKNELRTSYTLLFLLLTTQLMAQQLGGTERFSFLTNAVSPSFSALGGVNVSKTQADPNAFLQNPALLDSATNNQIALNFHSYFASTQFATVAYTKTIAKANVGIGIQYLNYGTFQGMDALGNSTGEFYAKDVALTLSHSRRQGNITFGANLKYVNGMIEQYSASAIMLDFGGVFKHPKLDLSYGITVKNIGMSFRDYTDKESSTLPLDVQMGLSFKPQYMPIRVSLTAHHLYQYDIAYLDKSIIKKDLNGNVIENTVSTSDKIARHFVLGLELLLSKQVNLLVGYNHLRSQELSQTTVGGLSGFSVGALFKSKFFNLSYSFSGYNNAGNVNSLGLVCNLARIGR